MKKRNIITALLLGMAILAGCSAGEKKTVEGVDKPQKVIENVEKDLGEIPKTDKKYTKITKEEFRELSMDYGIIPLDDEVIKGQGFIPEQMGISVLDSPVIDAQSEEEFMKAKEAGHKLFRAMYLHAEGKDFESTVSMFLNSEEEFDMKDGMLGENSLYHISYIENLDAYSLLSIVDNTVLTIESFDKESIIAFAKLVGYPCPENEQ